MFGVCKTNIFSNILINESSDDDGLLQNSFSGMKSRDVDALIAYAKE